MTRRSISVLLAFVLIAVDKVCCESYGIMAAESSSEKENFCIIFFPQFSELPEEKSQADFHIVQDESDLDLCIEKPMKEFKQKVVLLKRNNCSVAIQAQIIQEKGGIGAVFITPSRKVDYDQVNSSSTEGVNITVALISENSVRRLRNMKGSLTVCMYAPHGLNFDLSLLAIWIIALFTVGVGSYWSGLVRYALYSTENNKLPETECENSECENNGPSQVKYQVAEESSMNISPYAVGVFVFCMTATLLLLYFFFDYLVYFLISLFVIVSINSVYVCLHPLVMKFPNCLTLFECRYGEGNRSFDCRHLFLVIVSVGMSVTWVVTRKEKYSWILQDILGVIFCINMLKTVRMPNLKICTLLLSLLFIYDIFFVFVTPLFTAKGQSVMEQVATGRQSDEALPMMLRVPHFSFHALTVCYQQFSLLGFGDILVPGLLVSYSHGFDMITSDCHIYFMLQLSSYGIGLFVTFIGLFLMETAQPALLYLVPATLIPTIILSWCRGDLNLMWNGFKPKGRVSDVSASESARNNVNMENSQTAGLPAATGMENPATFANDVTPVPPSMSDNNERKQLLKQ